MRILFLTPEFPYPAQSGGTIKTKSILDHLGGSHEIHLLCFRRRPLTEEQARWARSLPRVECLPLSRGRTAGNLLRSYLRRLPLSVYRNHSPEMARLVRERLEAQAYDAVFVDGWLMAQYLPPNCGATAILHQHNAEHLLWLRQARREMNPPLKLLTYLEYLRVRRYEASILGRFHWVFAVSRADRRAFLDLGADPDRTLVLPNLPDQALLERPALSFVATLPQVLYFGTLSWEPNIEGVERFLRRVLPLVRRRLPQAQFLLAGSGAPARLRTLASHQPGVLFLGPVDDAEPLYRRARVFVEATETGGGTRLKVLNALARGLPTVASPQGAEGLEVNPGWHLLIARGPEEMANAVCRLMEDETLWRRLSENGREIIRQRYVPQVAYRPLDEVLSGA